MFCKIILEFYIPYIYNDNDGYCIYAGYCIRFRLNLKLVDPTYIFAFTFFERKENKFEEFVKKKENKELVQKIFNFYDLEYKICFLLYDEKEEDLN